MRLVDVSVDLRSLAPAGASILDILLPKLTIDALPSAAAAASAVTPAELFHMTSSSPADVPGHSPSSENVLLRSGSPPLPAHPPDSPFSPPGGVGESMHQQLLDDARRNFAAFQ